MMDAQAAAAAAQARQEQMMQQMMAQQKAQLDAQDKEMALLAQEFKALGSKADFEGFEPKKSATCALQ
jgi:hypothetical protein